MVNVFKKWVKGAGSGAQEMATFTWAVAVQRGVIMELQRLKNSTFAAAQNKTSAPSRCSAGHKKTFTEQLEYEFGHVDAVHGLNIKRI